MAVVVEQSISSSCRSCLQIVLAIIVLLTGYYLPSSEWSKEWSMILPRSSRNLVVDSVFVLSYVTELKGDIPHFSTSCLEVENIFNERELVCLANILGNAPCLEFLTLNIGYWGSWRSWKKYVNYPRSETWELCEIVLPTLLCTVKTITINNLFRNIHISYGIKSANNVDEILEVIDEEIKLVKHLLKISNILEKMVIIISNDAALLHSFDFLTSITRKLLNLPRTSLNVQIDVSYGKPQKV